MKKKYIIPILIILILGLACFLFKFFYNENNDEGQIEKIEKIFEAFGNGLTDLGIDFTEASIDVSDYDSLVAKMYISDNSRVAIYYLDPNSENYETIKKDGKMINKSNKELVVSGIVENGYLFYLEQNFPKGNDVYELFVNLTK